MLLLLSLLVSFSGAYLPIICMHGMNSDHTWCNTAIGVIQQHHPGTHIVAVPKFENEESFLSLNFQANNILRYVKKLVRTDSKFRHGYHLLCHSQGALLCRCVTELWNGHKINTLVSLAGPQMGVYGEEYLTDNVQFFDKWPALANATVQEAYKIFDATALQDTFSVANMWHDANHEEDFLDNNLFLPKFNNLIGHPDMDHYKRNIVSLQQAVFMIGDFGKHEYDGAVGPWQTGIWGFWGTNGDDGWAMKDVTQHRIWTEDLIGLQALDTAGKLYMKAVPNIEHEMWMQDRNTFEQYVLKWLI